MVMPVAGLSLNAIAARLGGDVLGDGETLVSQVAALSSARPGEISFLSSAKYRAQLHATQASALILPVAFADATDRPRIIASNPYAYYARLAALLNPSVSVAPGVSSGASVASQLPASVSVASGVSIGTDVVIGEGTVIYPNCVIGNGVRLGAGVTIYPNVVIYDGCSLGDRSIVHSGAVIGADGFGFAPDQGEWVKIPHLGAVRIGNDVEIGANTTVDRGALDDTVIEDGCKLDNQIHIAHNCVIGAHTVIAGCVGIAGSARIGPACRIGGAAMILGHLEIAGGTEISPGSMVMKSIAKPGKYTALFPLLEHEDWVNAAVGVRRLNKLSERISELENKLKEMSSKG